MVKKDKMISCEAPRCRNQAGKNSNVVALVTTIRMLL